jgi:hypothetical protein
MLKKIVQISLCLIAIFFTSCKKDPELGANGGGTASFTFAGTPSSCATPVIAGTYSAGVPMTFANTLTFSVHVSVKGTYNIRTTSANGVWFTGSGTFTVTGDQTIVLTGNGTPVRTGDFTFVPAMNNTCNFSVTFLDGAPPAVFTYAGAPAACTAPVISGTYATGIVLNSGNYVDLAVNVTTTGAYTVSTNNAGGISFTGSGAFTATGAQVIRLIGNGTPSGPGTFTYTPSGGCSFSITVTPPPPPASFTFDGAPGNCTAPTISGTYSAGTALNSSNTIVLGVNVTTAGLYSVTTNNDNGVTFSASGVFAGTGAQTITLRSTNTPTAAGTFTYTPSGGCSFDITYTGGGGGGGGDFLKCTIDGTPMDFSSGLGAFLSGGNFSAEGYLGNAKFDLQLNDNNADIAVGSYNKFSLSNMNKYCLVTYWPSFVTNPGTFWLPGFTNPNPFTVTVQTLTASPNKITGIFSGDIFDASGGNRKIVTNGSFSITY